MGDGIRGQMVAVFGAVRAEIRGRGFGDPTGRMTGQKCLDT